MEAVDDIVVHNVGDGSTCVEESLNVRPQGLAAFLFTQAQVMTSGRAMNGSSKVVDEVFLQVFP